MNKKKTQYDPLMVTFGIFRIEAQAWTIKQSLGGKWLTIHVNVYFLCGI